MELGMPNITSCGNSTSTLKSGRSGESKRSTMTNAYTSTPYTPTCPPNDLAELTDQRLQQKAEARADALGAGRLTPYAADSRRDVLSENLRLDTKDERGGEEHVQERRERQEEPTHQAGQAEPTAPSDRATPAFAS